MRRKHKTREVSATLWARRGAFTLIELIIVVIIVGILSAMVAQRSLATRSRAQLSATASAIRSLTSAFQLYYQANGRFPQDFTGGVFPTPMANYIRRAEWDQGPAIGGKWDWNGWDQAPWNSLKFNSVSIWFSPGPAPAWSAYDSVFDDSNIRSGVYRVYNGDRNYCLPVDP